MRFVLVNHCHPDTPHVCATRAREFAAALAAASHRVVLLTATLGDAPAEPPPAPLAERLAAHDWSRPFHLACAPVSSPALALLRGDALPWPLRKVLVAGYYWATGGMFADWRAGSRAAWPALAEAFHPDAVWGVFGNTDAWMIAQGIAARSKCPWVGDVKDHWSTFIPSPLRAVLARRFADVAHITAFSESHVDRLAPWFRQPKTVVYSGLSESLLALPPSDTRPRDGFRLVLSGSLYEDETLNALIAGIRDWLAQRIPSERAGVEFIYAGTDRRRFERAAGALGELCRVEAHDFLPFGEWRTLTLSAHANIYTKTTTTYHHKLIELLSADRPVISFPGEEAEARGVATSVGATLYSCEDPDILVDALELVWKARRDPPPAVNRARLAVFSWTNQAAILGRVLADAAREARP